MFNKLTMAQLSFKIPDNEIIFLKWLSEKTAEPVSSIYRKATLKAFREWKLDYLLNEYQKGAIGFKTLCKLANLSFNEGVLLLEEKDIEPPISKLLDEYSSTVREKLTISDVLREGKAFKRTSKEYKPKEE